jgi:hypothetical protein
MLYDVTILTVRPGTTPQALPQVEKYLGEIKSAGRLLACWFTELGALNQIMLIREYESETAIVADRDAAVRSSNPYGIADLTTVCTSDTYRPFPIMQAMHAGAHGPVFEVRTYALKPNGLAPTVELWNHAVPGRLKLSPLLAAMYSLGGAMPRFVHIWPYASLDDRQRIRGGAVTMGVWPPPGGPDQLLAQQADIYFAATFSPIR